MIKIDEAKPIQKKAVAVLPCTIVLFALCLLTPITYSQSDQQVQLTVSPSECVVLEQGRDCHVTVRLTWQSSSAGDYCLYASDQRQPLRCWQARKNGEYSASLVTERDIEYYMTTDQESLIQARAILRVAWVYRKSVRPRRQWRLF